MLLLERRQGQGRISRLQDQMTAAYSFSTSRADYYLWSETLKTRENDGDDVWWWNCFHFQLSPSPFSSQQLIIFDFIIFTLPLYGME